MIGKNSRFFLFVVLFLLFILSGCARKTQVGDIIEFSKIKWRVLAVEEEQILIITQEVMNLSLFHSNRDDITWESSFIRSHITRYYTMAQFSEREDILETDVINDENPMYGTPGGNATVDRVFLLSAAEVYQYFLNDEDRVAYFEGKAASWWLRTPGLIQGYTSSIGEDGSVDYHGSMNHQTMLGVRPAMWIKPPRFQAKARV